MVLMQLHLLLYPNPLLICLLLCVIVDLCFGHHNAPYPYSHMCCSDHHAIVHVAPTQPPKTKNKPLVIS